VDEKVRFTPTGFTNAGFKVIAAELPVSEAARVHGNVLQYLAACVGQD
jgi:hypothetical protein